MQPGERSYARPAVALSVNLVPFMKDLMRQQIEARRRRAAVVTMASIHKHQHHGESYNHQHYTPLIGDVLGTDSAAAASVDSSSFESGYLVRGVLGGGTFGVVVRCLDLVSRSTVAVKVISSREEVSRQGRKELLMLQWLRFFAEHAAAATTTVAPSDPVTIDEEDRREKIRSVLGDSKWARDLGPSASVARILSTSICHVQDAFVCREHLCLVFPLLSVSLYDVLKQTSFCGLSIRFVRKVALQLAQVLYVLRYVLPYPVIHCDIKPENVLLRHLTKSNVVLIDFGSSYLHCDVEHKGSYVQSRFYRAPEVILNAGYACPADAWSLGAMLVELFVGDPLFPGRSEAHQLQLYTSLLGQVPDALVASSRRRERFFDLTDNLSGGAVGGTWVLRKFVSSNCATSSQATTPPDSEKTKTRSMVADSLSRMLHDHKRCANQPPLAKRSRVEAGGGGANGSSTEAGKDEELVVFADFVAGLLRYDPSERLTPRQMLHHPFLKRHR